MRSTVGELCAFHDLRRSHAALLVREGLHPKVIQQRMGHASIRTTLDTYAHLLPGSTTGRRRPSTHLRVGLVWG